MNWLQRRWKYFRSKSRRLRRRLKFLRARQLVNAVKSAFKKIQLPSLKWFKSDRDGIGRRYWKTRRWRSLLYGIPCLLALSGVIGLGVSRGEQDRRDSTKWYLDQFKESQRSASKLFAAGKVDEAKIKRRQAQTFIEAVHRLSPHEPGYLLAMAELAKEMGEIGRCKAILGLLAPADHKGYPPAHLFLGELLLAERPPTRESVVAGENHLKKVADEDNAVGAEACARLGERYAETGYPQLAILRLRKTPQQSLSRATLALSYLLSNNFVAAEAEAKTCVENIDALHLNNPADTNVRMHLVYCCLALRNFPRAISLCNEELASAQAAPERKNDFATLRYRCYLIWASILKNDPSAITVIEQALRDAPGDALFLHYRDEWYFGLLTATENEPKASMADRFGVLEKAFAVALAAQAIRAAQATQSIGVKEQAIDPHLGRLMMELATYTDPKSTEWIKARELYLNWMVPPKPNQPSVIEQALKAAPGDSAFLRIRDDLYFGLLTVLEQEPEASLTDRFNVLEKAITAMLAAQAVRSAQPMGGNQEKEQTIDLRVSRLIYKLTAFADPKSPEGKKARALLQEQLTNGSNIGLAHYVLGIYAYQEKNCEAARSHFEQARKSMPSHPALSNNLAWVLSQSDPPELERALEIINLAIDQQPTELQFRHTRGSILVKMARWQEAITDLELALKGSPHSDLHAMLAQAYEMSGNPMMAAAHKAKAEEPKKQKDK